MLSRFLEQSILVLTTEGKPKIESRIGSVNVARASKLILKN
jgi:hypothetical protein